MCIFKKIKLLFDDRELDELTDEEIELLEEDEELSEEVDKNFNEN